VQSGRAISGQCWGLLTLSIGLALTLNSTAIAQAKQSKSASLGRYIPAKSLVVYVEFDGLDQHSGAWKKSAFYKLLNETKLGLLLEDLTIQAIEKLIASSPAGTMPRAAEVLEIIKAVARDGFAFGLCEPSPMVFVVRNGSRNGVLPIIRRFDPKAKVERRGARTLNVTGKDDGQSGWWVEGDDLVVFSLGARSASSIIAALEGTEASATTHPIRVDLARPESDFEPVLFAFVDLSAPKIQADLNTAGVGGLKHVDYRWGFQNDAVYSVFRISAPSPRGPVLGLIESALTPTFEKTNLPPIPANITSWTAFSFNPGALWGSLSGYVKAAEAKAGQAEGGSGMAKFEQAFAQNIKVRIKEDLLDKLGPKWLFYSEVDMLNPSSKPRGVLLAEIRNSAGLAPSLDRLMAVADSAIQGQKANPRAPRLRKLQGTPSGYQLTFPRGALPPPYPKDFSLTMLVGRNHLAFGLDEPETRAVLAAKAWTPGPDYAAAFSKLPSNLVALSVSDPRSTLPELIATLPETFSKLNAMMAAMPNAPPPLIFKIDRSKLPPAAEVRRRLFPGTMAVSLDSGGLKIITREPVPSMTSPAASAVGVALLLPAVQAAREAARRSQCVNNFKQIGLALHKYHFDNSAFPAAAIVGKDGKPLLSWRVAILPYIEQQELYNEFHLDEPWDSPHNKALIPRMPTTYFCPSRPSAEPGTTSYLALVGNGALFEPNKPVSLKQVTDGSANTLAVVESTQVVPWTKPADVDFSPRVTIATLHLGSNHTAGMNALFADGSIRYLKSSLDSFTFRAMITKHGGEVIQNQP
jgi:hypothetical protein